MNEERKLRQLESQLQMTANDVLDVMLRNNRLHVALKEAIAREHLRRYLSELHELGQLEAFERIDREGQPDFRLTFKSRSYLLECRNVQEPTSNDDPIIVDFWRTERSFKDSHFDYCNETESQILAACLFNHTDAWEFRFVRTGVLVRLLGHPGSFYSPVKIDDSNPLGECWSSNLVAVLRELNG